MRRIEAQQQQVLAQLAQERALLASQHEVEAVTAGERTLHYLRQYARAQQDLRQAQDISRLLPDGQTDPQLARAMEQLLGSSITAHTTRNEVPTATAGAVGPGDPKMGQSKHLTAGLSSDRRQVRPASSSIEENIPDEGTSRLSGHPRHVGTSQEGPSIADDAPPYESDFDSGSGAVATEISTAQIESGGAVSSAISSRAHEISEERSGSLHSNIHSVAELISSARTSSHPQTDARDNQVSEDVQALSDSIAGSEREPPSESFSHPLNAASAVKKQPRLDSKRATPANASHPYDTALRSEKHRQNVSAEDESNATPLALSFAESSTPEVLRHARAILDESVQSRLQQRRDKLAARREMLQKIITRQREV